MKKAVAIILLLTLAGGISSSNAAWIIPSKVTAVSTAVSTAEYKSPNFWTELDITFWQSAPFMLFWGYVIDQEISPYISTTQTPHWAVIVPVAAVISGINAYLHAQKATTK